MTVQINIKGDVRAVVRDLNALDRKVVDKATVTALNKTLAQVNTRTRRALSSELGIAQKHIKPRLKQKKANFSRHIATLITLTAGIPMIRLPAGKWRGIHGAFKQTMPSGHEGVFKRRARPRLPIDEQRLDIGQAAERVATGVLRVFATVKFLEIFRHELSRRLRRR